MTDARPLLAEFIGTFTLCFVGAGSICANALTGGDVGLLGIALAHGLALAIMITAVAHISGGHLNPAVTFGMLVTRRVTLAQAIAYVLAQLAGAVAAGFLLTAVFAPEVRQAVGGGTPVPGPGVSAFTAFVVEIVLGFFLVFAVFGTAVDARAPRIGGFGIGLTVAFCILFAGPVTGASINPARSFGPALASGVWDAHWVYWAGPMLCGAIAALLYQGAFLWTPCRLPPKPS
jgi:MIP family channel proteins